MIPLGKTPTPVRISLLEERLQAYDELSKQMLSKLEQAVEKISESNQNISQILIRHEERIERSSEANDTILAMLNRNEHDFKDEIEKQGRKFNEEINKHEEKIKIISTSIEELKKNRWILLGIALATTFFLNQLRVVDKIIDNNPPRIIQPFPMLEYEGPPSTLQV